MTNTARGKGRTAGKGQASKADEAVLMLAREYLRVSVDRSGQSRSPEEQHAENKVEAARCRFSLGVPYRDDNRSASRYALKEREDFEQLIADLQSDDFGAQVLMLWESSRGSRQVAEWVLLIDLCEARGVLIHVTTHGRTYDPANGRDRRSLMEDATDSEYESWKISQRSKRAMAANAEAGKPHGRTPYGYRRLYDPVTRKFVAQEPDPVEAPVVEELFKRLKAKHSLRGIAADFETRGIRTRTGKVFSAQHLRSLALTRAYMGERSYAPGGKNGAPAGEARHIKAQWKPIVTRGMFLAVQRILDDPERVTRRPGRGVHLLSMIARCAVCGGVLAARNPKDRATEYTCHKKSCVRIPKAELDAYAEQVMLGYLARDDVYAMLAAQADDDGDALSVVRDEIEDIGTELDELADQVGRGELSPPWPRGPNRGSWPGSATPKPARRR